MNGTRILLLKQALDQVNTNLKNELPSPYAEKAVQIINDVIKETIQKIFKV